jgi:hypothetical protein
MGENDKDEQHSTANRWDNKEVDRYQIPQVLVEKRPPSGRRRPGSTNSATILGDPHVGLAFHIRLMSCLRSGGIAGRPGPAIRQRARQYSWNRFFCQAATVRGWTKNSAARQPDHNLDMTDQSRRSAGRIRGLCPDFLYRDNWWRSAAFSICSDNRVRAVVFTNIPTNWINRIMTHRIGHHSEICNRINILPYSGRTDRSRRAEAHWDRDAVSGW